MIPEAAVEAGGVAICELALSDNLVIPPAVARSIARAALEAAEPHMVAGATVTTTKELDALPSETVIRDAEGHVLERWGDDPANVWVTMMVNAFIPRGDIALPATIIYKPTP